MWGLYILADVLFMQQLHVCVSDASLSWLVIFSLIVGMVCEATVAKAIGS